MRLFSIQCTDDHAMLFSGEDLRRLMLPLLLEQMLIVAMSILNTIMVASVGEAAVSAISLVDSINILLINVFAALATGGAVVTAQYLGRREPAMAGMAAKQLLYVMLAVSLLISAFSLTFYHGLLAAIFPGVDTDVMAYSKTYFVIIAFSFPFLSVFNGGSALLRAIGNSTTSLIVTLLMNLINVAGNALFIYGFRMGIAGAAFAALLARIVSAFIMLVLLKNPHHQRLRIPSLLKFQWDGDMVRRILGIGIPNGLENSLFQMGKILMQSLVSSLGPMAIAANAVASSLAGFQTIPGSAVSLALITVVGRCAGAKEYGQARLYVKKLMGFAYLSMALLVGVILLVCPSVIQSYRLSQETAATVWRLMFVYTIVCAISWSTSFALPNALRAAGDVKFTMMVSGLSMLVFRIGFSYLLVLHFHMDIMGIWVAMMIDWCTRSIAFIWRYWSGVWERRTVL